MRSGRLAHTSECCPWSSALETMPSPRRGSDFKTSTRFWKEKKDFRKTSTDTTQTKEQSRYEIMATCTVDAGHLASDVSEPAFCINRAATVSPIRELRLG